MIEGIVGLPGMGKTLYAVKLMLEARAKRRRVVANFHSTEDLWEYALWDEMRESDNTLVVIDEAHMWFSARNWNKQTQADLAVFQQHRKNGLDMIWIAQHENRVDLAIREVTAFVWRVTRVGPVVFARRCSLDEKDKVYSRRAFLIDDVLTRAYNTYEVIGDREGNGAASGRAKRVGGRVSSPLADTHVEVIIGQSSLWVPRNDPSLPDLAAVEMAARMGVRPQAVVVDALRRSRRR